MKLLILLSEQPYPPFGGSKARNLDLWPEVAKYAEIKAFGVSSSQQDFSFSFPTKFFPFERKSKFLRWKSAFQYSYHQWPVSEELKKAVEQEIQIWQPDVIHAEELRMWPYIPKAFLGKTSCTFHNVESELLKKTFSSAVPIFRSFSQFLHQKNLEAFESNCVHSMQKIFAYSEVDKAFLENKFKKAFSLTSGGVQIFPESWKKQTEKRTILFTGSLAYWPNIEALNWYIKYIHPIVRNRVEFCVAGSNASQELKETFRQECIRFVDSPLNLRPYYEEAALSIVPLLSGSGTRGKILESIGQGRMVVSTKKGAEGLSFTQGQGIHFADDATQFAQAILYYLDNIQDRTILAEKGFEKVQMYSWENVAKRLMEQWNQ